MQKVDIDIKLMPDFYRGAPRKFNENDFLEAVEATRDFSLNFNHLANRKKTVLPDGRRILLILGFEIKDSDWRKAFDIYNSVYYLRQSQYQKILLEIVREERAKAK